MFYGRLLNAATLAAWLALLAGCVLFAGCDQGPAMAHVRGQVLYRGQPLEFGNVMFQPRAGQPASGDIQPDGTFSLSTYKIGDGAVVGRHKVRITCYEFQRPGVGLDKDSAPMPTFGKLFIPKKYTTIYTSGLEVDVELGMPDPLLFDLADK